MLIKENLISLAIKDAKNRVNWWGFFL